MDKVLQSVLEKQEKEIADMATIMCDSIDRCGHKYCACKAGANDCIFFDMAKVLYACGYRKTEVQLKSNGKRTDN